MLHLTRTAAAAAVILSAGLAIGGCGAFPTSDSPSSVGPFMNNDDPPTSNPANHGLDQTGFLVPVKGS